MNVYEQSSLRQKQLVQAALILKPVASRIIQRPFARKTHHLSEASFPSFSIPLPTISPDVSHSTSFDPQPSSLLRDPPSVPCVDVCTAAVPTYKSIPVYNVLSSIRLPHTEQSSRSVSPTTHSRTNLLRKRYSGKRGKDAKAVVRCKPYISMVLPEKRGSFFPVQKKAVSVVKKTGYEPLSRRKSRAKLSSEDSVTHFPSEKLRNIG